VTGSGVPGRPAAVLDFVPSRPATPSNRFNQSKHMGKGDKRTRRGKISNGSYGKSRQKKSRKSIAKPKPAAKG
jgi:30S ribosomal protein S31